MRFKNRPLLGLLAAICGLQMCVATQDLFIVSGVEDAVPPQQVDAVAYANYGTHVVDTLPAFDNRYVTANPIGFIYEFLNTEYFTNRGELYGRPGFRFETATDTGVTRPAVNFINESDALISASSSGYGSFLLISAENIQNRGRLVTDGTGIIQIAGDSVNLSRGTINIETFGDLPYTDSVTPTNFFPAARIQPIYWGGFTNVGVDLVQFYVLDPVGPRIITPIYGVTNQQFFGRDQIRLPRFGGDPFPIAGVNTNSIDETNQIVQAIFVGYNTNLLQAQTRFSTANTTTNYAVAGVQLLMEITNSVTGVTSAERIYLTDDLGARTNHLLLENMVYAQSWRPANYRVSRGFLADYASGNAGNSRLSTNLFYGDTFTNDNVQALYTAYAPYVASLAGNVAPPPIPGATISNATYGRLEIDAKTLNLNKLKARANGMMSIRALHTEDTREAQLEGGAYMFDLASTNGTLRLDATVAKSGKVFDGPIYMWSALWTNGVSVLATNVVTDTNDPPVTTTNVVTNIVSTGYHVFVVDAYGLGFTQEVTVDQLILRATNVIVSDHYSVSGKLLIDAESLLLEDDLRVAGGRGNFAASNAPTLHSLTNHADFNILGDAILGPDRAVPYQTIANDGLLAADSIRMKAELIHNRGQFTSRGFMNLEATVAKFEDGQNRSFGDMILVGRDLKFHQFGSVTDRTLILNPTNSLSDSGGSSGSSFSCNRGFQLLRKPTYGDLLGTRLSTSASDNSIVDHYWAAEDRGVSLEGFNNNVAVGRLVLSAAQGGVLRMHGVAGSPAPRAIYADYLDLQGFVLNAWNAGQLGDALEVDANVTIYYAYSNVPVEALDGALGGRLRWVSSFAGPNSSVLVGFPSGASALRNRGLRESIQIDSDEDGLANGYDPTPFPEPEISVVVEAQDPLTVAIAWRAAPLSNYRLEFQDNPESDWQLIEIISNDSSASRDVVVKDVVTSPSVSRYYRVRYNY